MRKYALLLLLILMTALAATLAGCTQPGPTASPVPAVTATPGPAGNGTTTIGEGILMFDQSKFSEFEYKVYASDGKVTRYMGNIKSEYNKTTYGSFTDARHMRQTTVVNMGTDSPASTTVTDLYYHPDTNMLLGGHTSVRTAAGTQEKDIAASDVNYWNADMSSISSNVKFVHEGSEMVTVPLDTYLTKKYTSVDSGITIWMAYGVPMPAKIAGSTTSNGTTITTTMELVNYS